MYRQRPGLPVTPESVPNVFARSVSDEAISEGSDCFASLAMTKDDYSHTVLDGLKELPEEPDKEPGKSYGDQPQTNSLGTPPASAMTRVFRLPLQGL